MTSGPILNKRVMFEGGLILIDIMDPLCVALYKVDIQWYVQCSTGGLWYIQCFTGCSACQT